MKKIIKVLPIIFLLLIFKISFGQNLYLENLKFKSFYSFSKLIVNPVQKISYLNSIADYSFEVYNKNPRSKTALNNYLTVLEDLEKTWSKFSFKYSVYPTLYERSMDLYFKQLSISIVKNLDKEIQKKLIGIIIELVSRIDNKAGIDKLTQISSKYNTDLEKLKIYQDIDLNKKINKQDLLQILKDLQMLLKEFENGERIIVGNHEGVERAFLEIQKEVKLAQQNIKDLKIEEYNKNIEKLKQHLDFIKKNSKKIK